MPAIASSDLFLAEAFSSIQGEGLYIGVRQVFLRLCDCNLDCRYCDTDFSRKETCKIETVPGSGRFQSCQNPVSPESFCAHLDRWIETTPMLHQAISLTGGEPLLHAEVLASWLPLLKTRLPLHLETNGTLHEKLGLLLPYIDFLSIDLKLSSVTGQSIPWDEHRQFLEIASGKPAQIKIVVDENLCTDELLNSARLAAQLVPRAPLFLQPVTRDGRPTVDGPWLMEWQKQVSSCHPDCRVVPQVHPLLGIA